MKINLNLEKDFGDLQIDIGTLSTKWRRKMFYYEISGSDSIKLDCNNISDTNIGLFNIYFHSIIINPWYWIDSKNLENISNTKYIGFIKSFSQDDTFFFPRWQIFFLKMTNIFSLDAPELLAAGQWVWRIPRPPSLPSGACPKLAIACGTSVR